MNLLNTGVAAEWLADALAGPSFARIDVEGALNVQWPTWRSDLGDLSSDYVESVMVELELTTGWPAITADLLDHDRADAPKEMNP